MFSTPTQVLLDERDSINVEGYRDSIKQRVAQLKNEIQALEGRYNSLSWPSRIPPEILSKVFIQVAYDSKHKDDDDDAEEEDLKWIRVTHVCRYWRETALDCLALWTKLSFVNPAFTELMIERSRNAPLSIECGWKQEKGFQDVLCKVLARTKQLGRVNLACYGQRGERLDLAELLAVISGPAPALEELELFMMEDDDQITLPERFLEGTAPHLTRLRLYNIQIGDWNDLPLRPTLTCLQLQERMDPLSNLPRTVRPSWPALYAALQEMPALQTLTLEGFLPYGNLPASLLSTSIALHQLRSLWLRDLSSAVANFFSMVHFPNTSDTEVIFQDTHETAFLHRFLDILAGSTGGLCKKPVRGLGYLDGGLSGGPRFTFRFDTGSLEIGKQPLVLSFAKSMHGTSDDLLTILHEDMDLSRLTKALFLSDPGLTKDVWVKVFGECKELNELLFEQNSFSETVSQALASTSREDPSKPTFPSLNRLDFAFHDFDSQTTSLLISGLQSRLAMSPNISINFMAMCKIDEEMLDRIVDSLPGITVNHWSCASDGDGSDLSDGQEFGDADGDGTEE